MEGRSRQQSKAAVQLAIEEELDHLPGAYAKLLYNAKCGSARWVESGDKAALQEPEIITDTH